MSHKRIDPSWAAELKILGEEGDQSRVETQLSWRAKLMARECALASNRWTWQSPHAAATSLFELGTGDMETRVTGPGHVTDDTVARVLLSQKRTLRSAEPEKKLPVSNGNHARVDTAAEWEGCTWVPAVVPLAPLLPGHAATSGQRKVLWQTLGGSQS
jgi:hypothetical protein